MALVTKGNAEEAALTAAAGGDTGTAGGGVSLGKGAWDCDEKCEIPADKEAEVFEEIANMDMPYEGIPTVPMRKDMDHMGGAEMRCEVDGWYRLMVCSKPDGAFGSYLMVKRALFDGGIARSNKPADIRNTPGIQAWKDLELIYAGQRMQDSKTMKDYHVPPGCQCLIAIERAKMELGKPEVDSAYWN